MTLDASRMVKNLIQSENDIVINVNVSIRKQQNMIHAKEIMSGSLKYVFVNVLMNLKFMKAYKIYSVSKVFSIV